ncbi:SDR family oxidoreductase [Nocardioides guangzhouensis]|uniref:SDR family oxidoreductase n=1 Tax=Nocardioides guangzhouensis TaxID=2497878 RepID=UPI001438570B|nr:SDR family oxidoreductase [Nocardioides guangzhouensis]
MGAFADAHVVVTGGSSGIGLAFVRRVLDLGARVSVIALDDPDLTATEAELRDRGAPYVVAPADVVDRKQVAAAVAHATEALGACDVLLTSAGIAHPGYFERLDDEIFRRTMEVDYFGTLHALREVVPSMMARRAGSVVGISSAAGLVGIFGYTPYAPAKFAVRGLLEALRCELAPYDVHVGCVCPPDTRTPQLDYENRFKPAETRAISGQIKPITADRMAAGIVRGVERREFLITTDWQTRLLARTSGLLRGTYFAAFDRRVRAAREGLRPPEAS